MNPRAAVPLQLAVLVLYLVGLIVLGRVISKRVKGSDSFFVADRQLTPGLIFATFLAANIGSGSLIAASGLAYRVGISAWWWVGSAAIGQLVFAFFVGPRIWRLAKEHGFYTAGDYLEHRYGSVVRGTIASVLWFGTLAILTGQLIAMSQILETVLGVQRGVGAAVGGVVVLTYFAMGGLLTSAYVNAVQLVVLLLGFAIGVPIALSTAGGWEVVVANAAPQVATVTDFFALGGLVMFAIVMPSMVVSPGLVQKGFGALDERSLKIGVAAQAAVLAVFAFTPAIVGLIAHTYDPTLIATESEYALPLVLIAGLPPVLGALGLAAVFSAEMSTADAILFMLSTSLSKDIYKRYIAPDASDAQVLRVARGAAIAGGVGGVLLAIFVLESVIASLAVFYSVLSVSLFVPIVAGLYTRRGGVPEAMCAIGVGVTTLVAATYWEVREISAWLNPTGLGILASAVAFFLILAVRRSPAPSETPESE